MKLKGWNESSYLRKIYSCKHFNEKEEKSQVKNKLFTLRHLKKKSKLYLMKQNGKIMK